MSPLQRAARYARTVRHLRWQQIAGRVWFRLSRPSPDTRPAPPLRGQAGSWTPPPSRPPSFIPPATFRLLGEEGLVAGPAAWNDPRRPKLWLYNLHYFDDLNAVDRDARREAHAALMQRWIAENPPGGGNGWEPYPVSLRVVNWMKWARAGHTLPPSAIESLAVQARWLSRRVERHLLGNHLIANAKALAAAGLFFDGPEADAWFAAGAHILEHETREQVLPDGGHFELTPMYHAIVLEDLLDLINFARAARRPVPDAWTRPVPAMLRWSRVMRHPDGEIPFFNDAAIGIASSPAELDDYAARLGFEAAPPAVAPVEWLADSGYARLQAGDAVVFFDAAAAGAPYVPAHAHADTLSFELSAGPHRVIVNGGTSVYGESAERLRQRGTAAHSTIEIDGRDSSEVWSGFRVGRRARPYDVRIERETRTVFAAHDGYAWLPGAPRHARRLSLSEGRLHIEDTISGSGDHSVVSRFHLHPGVSVDRVERAGDATRVRLRTATRGLTFTLPRDADVRPSSYHPQFGAGQPSHSIVCAWRGRLPCAMTAELTW